MPSSAFTLFQSFPEDVTEGVIDLDGDTFKVFACLAANAPVAGTDDQLSDLTDVDLSNMDTITLTSVTNSHSGATTTFDAADLTMTVSGSSITARYWGIYSDTATNDELVGYFDYGSDVVVGVGESLLMSFNASGIVTFTIT